MPGEVAPNDTTMYSNDGAAPQPDSPTGEKGPLFGVGWWSITFIVMAAVLGTGDYVALFVLISKRSPIALSASTIASRVMPACLSWL